MRELEPKCESREAASATTSKTAEQAGIRCLKVCGFCQNARYCCEACAAADWRRHKRACREHVAEREENTRVRGI